MEKLYRRGKAQGNWPLGLICGLLSLGFATQGMAQSTSGQAGARTNSQKVNFMASTAHKVLPTKTNQNNRVGERVSKPRTSQAFYWANNNWEQGGQFTRTYNSAGYMTEEIVTDPLTNYNRNKTTHIYNNQNELVEYGAYNWENNAWNMSFGNKVIGTYSNSLPTEKIFQTYHSGAWHSERKEVYNYNSSNVLTEIHQHVMTESGAWDLVGKEIYQYSTSSAKPTGILQQAKYDGQWIDAQKLTSLVWNEGSFKPLSSWTSHDLSSYVRQEWNGMALADVEKYTTTYQGTTGFTVTVENWGGLDWFNTYRLVEVYDDKGHQTLRQTYNWINKQWDLSTAVKTVNTYNAEGDLIETIVQDLDTDPQSPTLNTFVNRLRLVNSNFQVILSSKEELLAHLQVYPNPAMGQLTVTLEKGAGATVNVRSIAGKTLMKIVLSASEEGKLDISSLPAGTYLLQVQTKAGLRTQKIVKL